MRDERQVVVIGSAATEPVSRHTGHRVWGWLATQCPASASGGKNPSVRCSRLASEAQHAVSGDPRTQCFVRFARGRLNTNWTAAVRDLHRRISLKARDFA